MEQRAAWEVLVAERGERAGSLRGRAEALTPVLPTIIDQRILSELIGLTLAREAGKVVMPIISHGEITGAHPLWVCEEVVMATDPNRASWGQSFTLWGKLNQ